MASNSQTSFQVFVVYPEYRKQISYRIMFSVGISDVLQLVVHASSGVIMLIHGGVTQELEEVANFEVGATGNEMPPRSLDPRIADQRYVDCDDPSAPGACDQSIRNCKLHRHLFESVTV